MSAVWGWVIVNTMTMFVGLAMAEVVSALPSSGGPYFWASVLGGERWGPLAAFVTGWFNLLGRLSDSVNHLMLHAVAAWMLRKSCMWREISAKNQACFTMTWMSAQHLHWG